MTAPAALPRRPAPRGMGNRIRHALGMRQAFTVDGVRYREVTTQSLRHALSRQGPGFKEYDATFPAGSTMRIRCSPRRIYADLMPSRLAPVGERTASIFRPGMRVLLLEAGTGDAAAFIARRIAPSGAVVSLDPDSESVRYAHHRYPLSNVSFEMGGIDGLAGETDGAFNAVLAVEPAGSGGDPEPVLRELWRTVAPAGLLIVAGPVGERTDEIVGRLGAIAECEPTLLGDAKDGWTIALAPHPSDDDEP